MNFNRFFTFEGELYLVKGTLINGFLSVHECHQMQLGSQTVLVKTDQTNFASLPLTYLVPHYWVLSNEGQAKLRQELIHDAIREKFHDLQDPSSR